MSGLLDNIHNNEELKRMTSEELRILASEIRSFLIESISITGGHLSSNLGVVDLTIALHYCFQTPADKIVWDVGHQAYTHKILTGRKNEFTSLRKFKGLSGFPKVKEDISDTFNTGHSSTSISVALGFAKARDLRNEEHHVVSVIGDGSMTGGMAFEALNNASRLKTNFIVVLNDNNMSISENVGGLSKYLSNFRTEPFYTSLKEDVEQILKKIPGIGANVARTVKRSKESIKQLFVPGMLFEELGFTYLGPVDGHNIEDMVEIFNKAKRLSEPVLVHVLTKKGKGYKHAERFPAKFHGIEPFNIEEGKILNPSMQISYTEAFGNALVDIAKQNDKVLAITAAMLNGTGLKKFKNLFPERFFDVGIAEQHAVTFAAGLAADGFKPVVAIYSSFLQRSYDQIIHDVCIQNLPVVFAIDRAGIVGADGETHQGMFDLSYLTHIPNMTVCAPKNDLELEAMLRYAVSYDGPIAIRYPRGGVYKGYHEKMDPIVLGQSEVLVEGKDIAILALGSMVAVGEEIRKKLQTHGYQITLINARFAKPFDEAMIDKLLNHHHLLVTLEENAVLGGYGQGINAYVHNGKKRTATVLNIGLPDNFIEQGSIDELRTLVGFDTDQITRQILEANRG